MATMERADNNGIHIPLISLMLLGIAGLAIYSFDKKHKEHKAIANDADELLKLAKEDHLHHYGYSGGETLHEKYWHGVPLDHYGYSAAFDPISVPRFTHKKDRIVDMSQDAITPHIGRLMYGDNPFTSRVQNDSYSPYNDDKRGDGFSYHARAYNTFDPNEPPRDAGSMAPAPFPIPINQYQEPEDSLSMNGPGGPMPVNSTDPAFDAAVADTNSIPTIMVDPSDGPGPRIIGIENQVLKMIIANSPDTNTILSNIDTIKRAIHSHHHKLREAYDQVQRGNITPIQLNQFIMQVISDIAQQLELPLSPGFANLMNSSPFQPVSPAI